MRPHRGFGAGFLLLFLLATTPVASGGPDAPDPKALLSDARYLEHTERRPADALRIYQALLARKDLTGEERGEALLGAANCEIALGHAPQAVAHWEQVLADPAIPAEAQARARELKGRYLAERTPEEILREQEEARQRALDEQRRKQRDRSLALVQEARAALAQRRFDQARDLCLRALNADPENAEAKALLDEIDAGFPDRAQILKTVVEFVVSARREEFQRLRQEIAERQKRGRDLFGAEDWTGADREFRQAIATIDATEDPGTFSDERMNLSQWLRKTLEKARKAGVALEPEPPLPDPALRETGTLGRFFQLLSEMFTTRDRAAGPLKVYEVTGPAAGASGPDRTLGPSDFGTAIVPTLAPGALTRARWAERWIRSNVQPATWPDPARRGSPGAASRILERYGDLLIVQHTPAVQQEIADLLASLGAKTKPMVVDVAVFAAAPGGTVRASERLKAVAAPKDTGLDPLVPGRLLEECTKDLAGDDPRLLVLLGTARVPLRGAATATLELTQMVAGHPLLRGLKPPALTVPDAAARYGLWLEIYAEDLAHAKSGPPSSAFSVRALARRPLRSVVVPKPNREGPWTRLPREAQQVQESDAVLPHAGTLMLLGVANPFERPASGTSDLPSPEEFPDLVILLGVRPGPIDGGTVPVPDPPRPSAETPDARVDRGHALGALGEEVLDEVVPDGWPERPAATPLSPISLREYRDSYLAGLVADLAGVWKPGSTEPNPVSATGGVATARVTSAAHDRIEAAAQRVRLEEDALYEITVVAGEAPLERADSWADLKGVSSLGEGRYAVSGPANGLISEALRTADAAEGSYAAEGTLLARATQQVVLTRIESTTIVEDLRARRLASGVQRYLPIYGRVEQGLVVEVRPGIEEKGQRVVTARVRAARLKALEPVLFAGVEQQAARVQVPRYHLPHAEVSAALALSDGESILLLKRVPEGTPRVVAVLVTTRKLQ